MFARMLTSALFAGAAAGLIASLLQFVFVQPVLLHAELYESGELVHFGAEAVSAHPELPGFDVMRDGLSAFFTILIYTGYSLMLVGLMAYAAGRGTAIDARSGMIWGIAGFIAVHFAPGFSLAPEVPGVAAADVELRQIWWFATVITAAIGLWLVAFVRNPLAWGLAVILFVAPHIYGAPEPEAFTGPVPTEIGALFAARALGVGFAAWVLLGLFAGYFWQREATVEPAAQHKWQ